MFKERAKLYRWDRDVSQWKERGVGDIKILWHTMKNYYRILMRRDQVFKVCANHVITKTMELKPLNVSNNALVWTASDYAGEFLHSNVLFSFWTFLKSITKQLTTVILTLRSLLPLSLLNRWRSKSRTACSEI